MPPIQIYERAQCDEHGISRIPKMKTETNYHKKSVSSAHTLAGNVLFLLLLFCVSMSHSCILFLLIPLTQNIGMIALLDILAVRKERVRAKLSAHSGNTVPHMCMDKFLIIDVEMLQYSLNIFLGQNVVTHFTRGVGLIFISFTIISFGFFLLIFDSFEMK